MAEHYVQGSFAFTCSIWEAALIEEGWQLAADLMGDFAPDTVSEEFVAVFPPLADGDQYSGFRSIFDDANFPDFGADIQIANSIEDPKTCTVGIHGTTDFQPWPIAGLIQRCCRKSLAQAPIGFDWSYSCTKPRPDSFGGGWCLVFTDRIDFQTTTEQIARALEIEAVKVAPAAGPPDPWIEDPEYPTTEWAFAAMNGDTRLGYLDWVMSRMKADQTN